MRENLFEKIKQYLPKYLTPEHQRELFSELQRFQADPNSIKYYLEERVVNDYLQGDGWKGFIAIKFETLKKKTVSGVIISNSCDIDLANLRDFDPKVLFVPLIKLSKYVSLLKETGKDETYIISKLENIKKQRTSSIFYFPAYNNLMEESITTLDDIHQHPLSSFHETEKSKIFTLSQCGFYIFLIKLSIHFTRFNEGITRFA